MNKEFKYILQPYRGIASRHACPSCEHKNEFTLYVDTSTGHPLHPSVGKCNRESKCGYHYTPGDYFRDNPTGTNNNWLPISRSQLIRQEEKTIYLPGKLIPSNDNLGNCNLYKFFLSKFGKARTQEVFTRYRVGSSKHWRNDNGFAAAFPQIDADGRLRQIKVIAYNPVTGKRLHKEHKAEKYTLNGYVKDTGTDKVWFAGKSLLNDYNANLQQCFFGEHLICKAEKLAIVESEKTAMIASLYMPDFVWLATGGKNGCRWASAEVSKVLSGKDVFLYPDLKCLEDWTEKATILKSYGLRVYVSRFLEDNATLGEKTSGFDIADYLINETLPEKPLAVEASCQPKSKNLKKPETGNADLDSPDIRTETHTPEQRQGFKNIGELLEYAHSIGVINRIKVNL